MLFACVSYLAAGRRGRDTQMLCLSSGHPLHCSLLTVPKETSSRNARSSSWSSRGVQTRGQAFWLWPFFGSRSDQSLAKTSMLSPGDIWILRQHLSMLLIHSWCAPAAHCPHAVPQHTPYCKVQVPVLPTALSAERYLETLFSTYRNTATSSCVGALCSQSGCALRCRLYCLSMVKYRAIF